MQRGNIGSSSGSPSGNFEFNFPHGNASEGAHDAHTQHAAAEQRARERSAGLRQRIERAFCNDGPPSTLNVNACPLPRRDDSPAPQRSSRNFAGTFRANPTDRNNARLLFATLAPPSAGTLGTNNPAFLRRQVVADSGALIHAALSSGANLAAIQSLIVRGTDVNSRNASGLTPVEVILRNRPANFREILTALKEAGADLAVPDNDGNTLLHREIMAGNLFNVLELMGHGVDINAFNRRTGPAIARYAATPRAVEAAMAKPTSQWIWGDTDQATPLHLAAAFYRAPEMICVLAMSGANVNARNDDQLTPLHWAAAFTENPSIIRALIEAGADINARGSNQSTPLHLAISLSQHIDVINALLVNDADLRALDCLGHTPVERALYNDGSPLATEKVALLKAAGADLSLADNDGNTLLHRHVMEGNLAGLKILLANDVDVNVWNFRTLPAIARYAPQPQVIEAAMNRHNWVWEETDQATPLHLAAAFGNDVQLIRALIRSGASIAARNDDQSTPLHWAAVCSSSPAVINTLIDMGADIEARDCHHQTPLHLAAACSLDLNVMQALLDRGAEVNAIISSGMTAVGTLLRHGAPLATEKIALLKIAGADLTLADCDGNTLLHRAVMAGNLTVIESLLANGADVNVRNSRTLPTIVNYAADPQAVEAAMDTQTLQWNDSDQATPLHLAAAFGNDPLLVYTLVENGAVINALNDERATPLHWAALCASNPEVINALIEAGADIHARNVKQHTPLHCAAAHGKPDTVTALLEGGAEVDSTSNTGATPLHLAAQGTRNSEVIAVLLDNGADDNLRNSDGETALDVAMQRTDPHAEAIQAALSAFDTPRSTDESYTESLADIEADFDLALRLQAQEVELHQAEQLEAINRQSATERTAPSDRHMTANTAQAERTATARRAEQAAAIAECRTIPLVRNVDRWYEPDTAAALSTIFERANAWRAISAEETAVDFSDFISSLTGTADYREPRLRAAFSQRVATILDALQGDRELRQRCFMLTDGTRTTCGDGRALTLNRMDVERINRLAEQGGIDTSDLIKIRSGMFRLDLLQKIAQEKIDSLRLIPNYQPDEAEVFLAFQTMLAERLKLPGVSQSMLYAGVAQIVPQDLEIAFEKVTSRENTKAHIEFVAEWEPWIKALERLEPEKFRRFNQRIEEEQEELVLPPAGYTDIDYIRECDDLKKSQEAGRKMMLIGLTRKYMEVSNESRPR